MSEVTFLLKGCFFTAFLTTILKGANIFCWLISLLNGKVTGKFVLSRFSSSAGSPQFLLLDIFLGKVLSFFYLVPEPGRSGPGASFFFCWYLSLEFQKSNGVALVKKQNFGCHMSKFFSFYGHKSIRNAFPWS